MCVYFTITLKLHTDMFLPMPLNYDFVLTTKNRFISVHAKARTYSPHIWKTTMIPMIKYL